MHQEADAHRERAGHRNLGGVQQCDDVPSVLFGGTSGEGGVQIAGDGEQAAHDVVGLKPVGLDERPEQLVCCREDLGGVVPGDRRRSADTLKPWGGRDMRPNVAEWCRLMLVTDDRLVGGRDLVALARAAERGGVTAVQLRLKLGDRRASWWRWRANWSPRSRSRSWSTTGPTWRLLPAPRACISGPDDLPVPWRGASRRRGSSIGASVRLGGRGGRRRRARTTGASVPGVETRPRRCRARASAPRDSPDCAALAAGRPCMAIGGDHPCRRAEWCSSAGGTGVAVASGILGAEDIEGGGAELQACRCPSDYRATGLTRWGWRPRRRCGGGAGRGEVRTRSRRPLRRLGDPPPSATTPSPKGQPTTQPPSVAKGVSRAPRGSPRPGRSAARVCRERRDGATRSGPLSPYGLDPIRRIRATFRRCSE